MISIDLIKQLRERTGASLQACKKALEETNGDENAAIEILRKKGEAKAATRGDRDTREGTVAMAVQGTKAVMLQLACETDFVAKSPDFVGAAEQLANDYLKQGESFDPSALLNDLGLKIGEKITLGAVKFLEAPVLGDYIHSNRKIGTLVALDSGTYELAKDIAMHVAAMNPLVLSPDEVSEDLISKEREIWKEQLKNEGKPEAMLDKIMIGKERKFREENALLKQPFVKNPEQTVEQLLSGAKIQSFVRIGQ